MGGAAWEEDSAVGRHGKERCRSLSGDGLTGPALSINGSREHISSDFEVGPLSRYYLYKFTFFGEAGRALSHLSNFLRAETSYLRV